MRAKKDPEEVRRNQRAAEARWHNENYEQISVKLPKGYRDRLNNIAASKGMSTAALLKAFIDENTPE